MARTHGTVKIKIDTTGLARFVEAMKEANIGLARSARQASRAFTREIRQMQRNMLTGPLSAERREIQAIGRREMAGAIAEFKARNGVAR